MRRSVNRGTFDFGVAHKLLSFFFHWGLCIILDLSNVNGSIWIQKTTCQWVDGVVAKSSCWRRSDGSYRYTWRDLVFHLKATSYILLNIIDYAFCPKTTINRFVHRAASTNLLDIWSPSSATKATTDTCPKMPWFGYPRLRCYLDECASWEQRSYLLMETLQSFFKDDTWEVSKETSANTRAEWIHLKAMQCWRPLPRLCLNTHYSLVLPTIYINFFCPIRFAVLNASVWLVK